jgi:hypothetical protein
MATYQGAMSLFAKHKDVQVALTVLRSRAILVMTRGKERTTGEPQTDPWPRRAVFQPQLCTYNSPSLQAKRGSPRLCPGSLLTPKPHSGYQMCMCVCVCLFNNPEAGMMDVVVACHILRRILLSVDRAVVLIKGRGGPPCLCFVNCHVLQRSLTRWYV